jgi:hypothetical protein
LNEIPLPGLALFFDLPVALINAVPHKTPLGAYNDTH